MNNQIEKNKLYNVKETSTLLRVTPQTVSKYLRNGDLKGEKKGPKKQWFVFGEEILRKKKEWNMLEI